MRLNLTAPLHSRDGTLTKGARMKNVVAENIEGVLVAMKRPGISMANELVVGGGGGTGIGQGLFSFEGDAVAIVDDVLYFGLDLLGAWSSSTSYGIGAEVSYEGEEWVADAPVLGVPPDVSGWHVKSSQTWGQL